MALQYDLFCITNSDKMNCKPVFPVKMPEAYAKLSETDKLACENLLTACYREACLGKKFIEIPEKISQEVLVSLGIPKNSAIFYWDTPGTK